MFETRQIEQPSKNIERNASGSPPLGRHRTWNANKLPKKRAKKNLTNLKVQETDLCKVQALTKLLKETHLTYRTPIHRVPHRIKKSRSAVLVRFRHSRLQQGHILSALYIITRSKLLVVAKVAKSNVAKAVDEAAEANERPIEICRRIEGHQRGEIEDVLKKRIGTSPRGR